MAAKIKPVISRNDDRRLRRIMACWNDDVQDFRAKHDVDFLKTEPLYAIPKELLEAIDQEMPNWLSPAETTFEMDLADLCIRHHAVGIFQGRPANYPFLDRPAIPILSEELFRRLGWDQYLTYPKAQRGLRECFKLLDPLVERSLAYVGWLLTNPMFLSDRDQLRIRWACAIEILGAIPAYPVRVVEEKIKRRRPRNGKDVTSDFIADFNTFYERWQLQRMPTWDLPEPCGANLTGQPLPGNLRPSIGGFAIDVPTTLRLPAHFPLRSILEGIQRQNTPEHLVPWLKVQDQQHCDGLRHGRFRTIFQIAFYRDTVLASRYRNRFDGNTAKLDEAFAEFLATGVDSIKQLRLKAVALKNHRA